MGPLLGGAGGAFNGWVSVAAAPDWNVTAVEDVMGNCYNCVVVQNTSTGQIA